MTAFSPVLTTAPTAGVGCRGTQLRRPASADFGDRGERAANSQPSKRSEQAAILLRIQLGHEQWRSDSGRRSSVTFLVTRPAIGSWRLWSGRCIECRSAQNLDLNLSAVHDNIRGRAYGQRF